MEKNIIKENVLGAQIEKLRFASGLSRAELAKTLGLSATQFGDILKGRSETRVRVLDKIADVFDVPTDYLLVGYHDAFVEFAIDGYMSRMGEERLRALLSGLGSFVGMKCEAEVTHDTASPSSVLKSAAQTSKVSRSKLRSYRERLGLTQAEISEKLGVSQNHYSNYENEKVSLSFQTHIHLCLILEKSSECITKENRSDLVLTEKQRDYLHGLCEAERLRFLRLIKSIYEIDAVFPS